MASVNELIQPIEEEAQRSEKDIKRERRRHATVQILRYIGSRFFLLSFSVVIGVYIAVLIANMGGYIDEIRRGTIRENMALFVGLNPEYNDLTREQRTELIENLIRIEEKRLGMDQPFILRSFRYLTSALSLSLGRAANITSDSGSRLVRLIILERLPPTLVLFASAQIVAFMIAVVFALFLSRRYGSRLDRSIVAMAPLSAAPSWFYGLFLILIFAAVLRIMPFGGMVSAPPPSNPFVYFTSLMRHLILPVIAIVLSAVFLSTYTWRTFFLIYSSEDYVEMAKAKGLASRLVERRYVLRPTMPTIVTSFALTLITAWQGAIILEGVFNWPGIGSLYGLAIGLFDAPVIIGNVVIYAYLLAITVFVLDLAYALLDPRVRVGGGGKQ